MLVRFSAVDDFHAGERFARAETYRARPPPRWRDRRPTRATARDAAGPRTAPATRALPTSFRTGHAEADRPRNGLAHRPSPARRAHAAPTLRPSGARSCRGVPPGA